MDGEESFLVMLVSYIFIVSLVLSMILGSYYEDNFEDTIYMFNVHSFDKSIDLKDDTLTLEDIKAEEDAGDWYFNSSIGLTSNTSGENRLLFNLEPDETGDYTNEFDINNPDGLSFDVLIKYYILPLGFRYGVGYHFTDSGIIPFEETLFGTNTYDIISYPNAEYDFNKPTIQTHMYKYSTYIPEGTGDKDLEYTELRVNGNRLHQFATLASWYEYPLATVYYSGIEVTGEGLSIVKYREAYNPSEETLSGETEAWNVILGMGTLLVWNLPNAPDNTTIFPWFWNIILIKAPLIGAVVLFTRIIRG